jgi:hypothetical protein
LALVGEGATLDLHPHPEAPRTAIPQSIQETSP